MSNHPKIAALRAALESEREVEASKHRAHLKEVGIVTESGMASWAKCANAYNAGHEAATERLLGLLEQAVETITTLGEKHPDCFCMDSEAISKEFLTTLADASGESKKENK